MRECRDVKFSWADGHDVMMSWRSLSSLKHAPDIKLSAENLVCGSVFREWVSFCCHFTASSSPLPLHQPSCTIWNWFSLVPCYSKGVHDVLPSYSLSVYSTHLILSASYRITFRGLSVNQIFWCAKLIGRSCVYSSADSSSYLFIISLIWLSELFFLEPCLVLLLNVLAKVCLK